MAFPFLAEEGFELGTLGVFDAEVDTQSKLDFPHYSDLARIPGLPAPYRGAFCMRVDLSLGTADAYVQETGSWDTAAAGTVFTRFYFWFGGNPVMADADIFGIWQLWSGASTVEATIGIQYTDANGYRLFANETAAAAGAVFAPLTLNQWHCIEARALIDSGAGNDGVLQLFLDGASIGSVTSLDQADITSGILGAVGIDAGTTRGILLFDDLIIDDARIYPNSERYPSLLMMTKSGHAFVGPGCIDNISMMPGAGTDNVLSVFDTDRGVTNDAGNIDVELKNTANNELVDPAGMPANVRYGAYVQLSGTNPRALVQIGKAVGYGSDGAIRTYGVNRPVRPGNIF